MVEETELKYVEQVKKKIQLFRTEVDLQTSKNNLKMQKLDPAYVEPLLKTHCGRSDESIERIGGKKDSLAVEW